jgi:hypothetical protein
MDELELIKKMALAADKESVPQVDVSSRVVASIADKEAPDYGPLAWIAGLSATAAVPAAFIAAHSLDMLRDPMVGVLTALKWVYL